MKTIISEKSVKQKTVKGVKAKAKQIEKEKKEALKIKKLCQLAEAKIRVAEAKLEKNRKWLPLKVVFGNNESLAVIRPNGFSVISDAATVEQIQAFYSDTRSKFNEIFSSISSFLNIDRHAICIIHCGTGYRGSVTSVRYIFNVGVNSFLKEECDAVFDPGMKSWSVSKSPDLDGNKIIEEKLKEYFSVVIDATAGVIWKSQGVPKYVSSSHSAFLKIPFHVPVKKSEILAGISLFREHDNVENLVIFNGKKFVPLTEECIQTRSPFLLFRYSVPAGQPRYISYSVIGKVVEGVAFGKNASMFLARYMDSCTTAGINGFETDASLILMESSGQRDIFHGGFSRFKDNINSVKNSIKDVDFFFLCSDYVSLVDVNYGADSFDAGVIAYANLNHKKQTYLQSVGSFFNNEVRPSGYPIVITRQHLDSWSDDYSDLSDTIIHELGHYLVPPDDNLLTRGVHGIGWAMYCDLLHYLSGEFCWTTYRDYYCRQNHLTDAIDAIIMEVGIPLLPEMFTRPATRNEIDFAWSQCITELISVSEKTDFSDVLNLQYLLK